MKDVQYNDQNKKYKRTNNDLQNTTQKIKDRATRTPLKQGVNLRANLCLTGTTSEAGTAYPAGYQSSSSVLVGFVLLDSLFSA